MAKSETWAETGVGALVLAAAAGFLIYALGNTSKGADAGGYELIGKFGDVGALATGADVRVAGVKVGAVSKIELADDDQVLLTLRLNANYRIGQDETCWLRSSMLGDEWLEFERAPPSDDKAAAPVGRQSGATTTHP